MGVSLDSLYNSVASSTIVTTVLNNPIYTAIVIVAIVLLIILLMFDDRGKKSNKPDAGRWLYDEVDAGGENICWCRYHYS